MQNREDRTMLIFALLAAAALTFNDTSGTETGYLVQIIKADGSSRFEVFPPNPGTGPVTLQLPQDGLGDCFLVSAFNVGGASPWSNRACLVAPSMALPNAPGAAVAAEAK